MLVGTTIVVGECIATSAASIQGLPFLLNVVDTEEDNNDFVNITQYFESEGITDYLNNISSKLRIYFNRTVFPFVLNDGTEVIVNLFFSQTSGSDNSANKSKLKEDKTDESSDDKDTTTSLNDN